MSIAYLNPREPNLSYSYQAGYEIMIVGEKRMTVVFDGLLRVRAAPSFSGTEIDLLRCGETVTVRGTVQGGAWAVVQMVSNRSGNWWGFICNDRDYIREEGQVREAARAEEAERAARAAEEERAAEAEERRVAARRSDLTSQLDRMERRGWILRDNAARENADASAGRDLAEWEREQRQIQSELNRLPRSRSSGGDCVVS